MARVFRCPWLVKAKPGKYSHALSQGARVAPLIVETTGAISSRSLRFVSSLTRRARGKNARDDTRYGRNRMSATSYYVHHTQRLSRAAAWGDVNGIHESVRSARQHLMAGGMTEARVA